MANIPVTELARKDQPLRLQIETFGHFAVRYGDREVVLNGRKARALLGYLVLTESGEETRERLVGLLWSETEETKARGSLRQALYEIREAFQAVGFDKFDADKHATRIDRDMVDVDLWDVMASARRGEPHPILLDRDRVTDSLMRELEAVDPSFGSWLLAKRQSLHGRLVAHLEDVLRGQTDVVTRNEEQVARALVKLDPTHEEAARALIRARVAAGDMGGALGIYKALWDLLENEFDVEPSKETQVLIADVKLAQDSPALSPSRDTITPVVAPTGRMPLAIATKVTSPSAFLRRAPKLIVSIGAFDFAGSNGKPRYLIDGFRRELIACLVRFREWVVRDRSLAPREVLPERGDLAEYAIDASAFEVGDAVRFVLTLLDIETNSYLWSEQLNLSVENWFAAQQLVVRRLTSALNVHLSAERLLQLSHRPVNDLKAYDAWLLGQATFLSFDPRSWDRAADLTVRSSGICPILRPRIPASPSCTTPITSSCPGYSGTPSGRNRRSLMPVRPRVWIPSIRAASCLSDGLTRCRSSTSRP